MAGKRKNKKPTVSDEQTRSRLINAAKNMFAHKGYDGTSVKEIAAQAKANISLISYHFGGKEGLLRACLEEFGKDRLRDSEKYLTPPANIDELRIKLKMWTLHFIQCHVDDDSICRILHRENPMENPALQDIFFSTFIKAFEAMVKFLSAAKKSGLIKKEVDPLFASSLIYGALIHLGRTQDVQKVILNTSVAEPKFRDQAVEQFIQILLNGIA